MRAIEREIARRVKAMRRNEVIMHAIAGKLTWIQAADICRITARQMRRMKRRYEAHGYDGLVDGRGGKPRRTRIAVRTLEQLCRLKRERYPDFSVQHFWEQATEKHQITVSYTWTLKALQAAGLAEKSAGRGQYRRKRERRPLVGMLLHLDASTHEWLADQPMWDLNVMLDDADGRILHARFVPQEGTASTFAALHAVLSRQGRFVELYTDRGSHFCHTSVAGAGPDAVQEGQVSRALRVLGIHHILARSPEARGRSERAFGTIQGRLPQELRVAGITDYAAANGYLVQYFVPDFNRRFTVTPAQAGSAFVPLVGVDLELLLSAQHERVVRNDSTVPFEALTLQLPQRPERPHYVRCPVLVHEFPQGTLGISYQGRLLARYGRDGQLLSTAAPVRRLSAARKRAQIGTPRPQSRLAIVARGASGRVGSTPSGRWAGRRGKSAQRAGGHETGRDAGRPTRSSPHAGGGGVPRSSLPAPPRPIPHGAAPHPPRSVRQRVENCSPSPKRKGRREF
jgi:Helix-turn-helix domain